MLSEKNFKEEKTVRRVSNKNEWTQTSVLKGFKHFFMGD